MYFLVQLYCAISGRKKIQQYYQPCHAGLQTLAAASLSPLDKDNVIAASVGVAVQTAGSDACGVDFVGAVHG